MLEKIKKFWFEISDKLRFLVVGGFNTGTSYLIYSVLMYFFLGEKHYQLALAIAWTISSVISFATQKCLVFPVEGCVIKQYLKCCTTWFFSYLLNALLLFILVEKININAYIAQIIATGFCAIFNYLMLKLFAFRKN